MDLSFERDLCSMCFEGNQIDSCWPGNKRAEVVMVFGYGFSRETECQVSHSQTRGVRFRPSRSIATCLPENQWLTWLPICPSECDCLTYSRELWPHEKLGIVRLVKDPLWTGVRVTRKPTSFRGAFPKFCQAQESSQAHYESQLGMFRFRFWRTGHTGCLISIGAV